MIKHKLIWQRLAVAAAFVFMVFGLGGATRAQSVTQGYQSEQNLQNGLIVRLKPGDSNKVQTLTQAEEKEMLGVVVGAGSAPVSLSTAGVDQEVFVATYGRYDVLVSNQGGPIASGDLVAVSSLRGVGMKSDSERRLVVGKALAAFDGKSKTDGTATLETGHGKRTVALGRVLVEIAVSSNPGYHKDDQAGVPDFLRKLAQAVTDQPISAFRIYASVVVIVLSLAIAGTVLFAGVRTGMTAIGRNPLAKRSITRNLIQVTLMSLIIFVIGAIAVYLLLRV
jgi:uncharacterized protein YjeT (DUF2065 family)